MAAAWNLPTPAPLASVHVDRAMQFREPKRFVHPYHLIGLRIRASGYYRLGGEELPDGLPLANFLPAGEEDVNGLVGRSEGWWMSFQWPELKIRRSGGHHLAVRWGPQSYRVARWKAVDAMASTRMQELFRAVRLGLERADLIGQLEARAFALRLFAFYADLPDSEAAEVGHRTLARFCALLRKHACSERSIEAIAEEAGGSADHLRELFRERYGVPPVKFRTAVRLFQARELLAKSGRSVKEVAHEVGYPDALYFSRVFRALYGVTPREIIRRFRTS
ncbi:MAG: AraC family transcriptional regulator [Planctomycetes bacterium]|nr:AraC family transcriptional regulator [Planctomycetota bacterium]